MRITPDLVAACPQFTNPLREREIKLRACKIPAIENLGATQDQFDTIDLSDNEIRKLENFPLLRRAKTILLSNNLIFRLSDDIKDSLPAVHTLMMANNSLLNLVDLKPLIHLPALTRLCLLDNNVTKQPNYRLYIINLLPNLMVLDFKKVKPKEREAAAKLFADGMLQIEEEARKPTASQGPGRLVG
ncbi:small nuclear ribonucleoprotein polypeptide A [Baffinella frigidus]|nr:small nuclear ribonucleoprotein polypeptide A [Cryptophyta sp. CCMP2293]